MPCKFIYKDTATGAELVMPVTPGGYTIEHGRKVQVLTMHQVGEVSQRGEQILLNREQRYLLPAHAYPFNSPGTMTDPFFYIEKFERWSDEGTVLRFIVSDTPINAAVILGPISYEHRETDQSGDIYLTVPMVGYRPLEAQTVERCTMTGNHGRSGEGTPITQSSYTVVAGDTLSAIARRFYGDANLYWRLAAANEIPNPNIISVGQMIKLPPKEKLPAANKKQPRSVQACNLTKLSYNSQKSEYEIQQLKAQREGMDLWRKLLAEQKK